MKILPKQPSKLLRLALSDLEKAEQHDDYKVSMNAFHEPHEGKCIVCLAGSVMAFSLESKKEELRFPTYFPNNEDQLNALNDFSRGDAWLAICSLKMDDEINDVCDEYEFPDYEKYPTGFKLGITTMIDDLEKAGL